MLRKPHAVIFDLDGTLLDSIPPMLLAVNRVLGDAGFPPLDEPVLRSLVGHGVHQLLGSILVPLGVPSSDLPGWVVSYRRAYQDTWPLTRPYPGIPEMLTTLIQAEIPLAVLSNKTDEDTRNIVAHCLPRTPFSRVIGDGPYPLKPNPSGALDLVHGWGLEPEEVWLVGDGLTDVETARRGGLVPVGVSWGLGDPDRLSAAGARLILGSPEEMERVFRQKD